MSDDCSHLYMDHKEYEALHSITVGFRATVRDIKVLFATLTDHTVHTFSVNE